MKGTEKVLDFVRRNYRSTGVSAPVSSGRRICLRATGTGSRRKAVRMSSHCQCDCACESPGDF